MLYVHDCLEPLVVVSDQISKYEKYLNTLEKPSFLIENLTVWAYRDPYHLFFTFERCFSTERIKDLGPSIFNLQIIYYNQNYQSSL
jgi:hypothetical protein